MRLLLLLPVVLLSACWPVIRGPYASTRDSGLAGTGLADTGSADTGLADTGPAETGTIDTGTADTGADTGATDTSVADTGDTGAIDTGSGVLDIDQAPVGSLVLSEVMWNPTQGATTPCTSETDYEYLEVYNAGPRPIALGGMVVFRNDGTSASDRSVVAEDPVVQPGGYAVGMRVGGDDCYGFTPDFRFDFALVNSAYQPLGLANASGPIDVVDFTAFGTRPPSGLSLQLDAGLLDAVSNDDPASWCPSTALIGSANDDLGTPGLPNDPCPP